MPKKILIILSTPKDTTHLNLGSETRELHEILQRGQYGKSFDVEWRIATHQGDLRRYILDTQPRILHFCGHGTPQGLELGDENGKAKVVANEVLTALLRNFADSLECVVLNACHSEPLADELVQHLNYVVGMNQAVFDDAAIAFSVGFYDALSAGESYEKAFEIAKSAVVEKAHSRDGQQRKATVVDDSGEAAISKNQEHLIPVIKVNPNPTEIKASQQPVPSSSSIAPSAGESNPFGVPYQRNHYFAGRKMVLLQLHEQLTQPETAAMTQVQVICGLGGIGKTQTAVEYAYQYHYEQPVYEVVFWVNASTEATLASDFSRIAEQVAVPGAETLQQDKKIAAVSTWLNTHRNWLLIFDNADQPDGLTNWMPTTPNGKVLITSRASVFDQLGVQRPLTLDVLSEAEALTLLFDRTGVPRTAEAEGEAIALNKELDGLPLALEQASAYIERQKIGFGRYLRAYHKDGLSHLEKQTAKTGRYPSSVKKTWKLNMKAATEENAAATALLDFSSFLAPDEIPECILTAGAEHPRSELGNYLQGNVLDDDPDDERIETVSLALRELLALLSQYSLVQWSGESATYSIHRLVQAVVRDQITTEKATDWLIQVTAAVAEAYPGQDFEHWPLCRQLLPHWLRIVEQAEAISYCSVTLGVVCMQSGFFVKAQGRYTEAESLYQRALDIMQKELGWNHPDTATSLNHLAELYSLQGRYKEAEPLSQRALKIRQAKLGKHHLDTARSLHNLAEIYRLQGRYREAKPLFQQALKIRQTKLGNHHPDNTKNLNNLALLYLSQRSYEEAEPLFQQALKIRQAELGNFHPDTASSLHNLAGVYISQKRYGEAESLFKEALKIYKKTLGNRHPDTATSLFNLAALYHQTHRSQKALSYIQQALATYNSVLGHNHPTTQKANNWLQAINAALAHNSE